MPPTTQPQSLDALFAAMSQYFQNQPNQVDLFNTINSARDPVGKQNKAYMPGVDNAANPFSNGFFKNQNMGSGEGAYAPTDPVARAATMGNVAQAFAQPAAAVMPQLPFTQALVAPVGQNPGFGSPLFPAYQNQLQSGLQQTLAARRNPYAF